MRLTFSLALLASFVVPLPIKYHTHSLEDNQPRSSRAPVDNQPHNGRTPVGNPSLQAAAAARAPVDSGPHPAIASYNYVSVQLAVIIADIKTIQPASSLRIDVFYRHAQETLDSLKKANREMRDGPAKLDLTTIAGFTPPLVRLNFQIHSLASTLKTKQPEIGKGELSVVTYQLLKDSYVAAVDMRNLFIQKVPSYLTSISARIIDEVVSTLGSARDLFRPADGDVSVVIVGPSNQPNQQNQIQPWQQPSQPYQYNPQYGSQYGSRPNRCNYR
jgi:hypothetical protein